MKARFEHVQDGQQSPSLDGDVATLDRRRAELSETEERYRDLLQTANVGLLRSTTDSPGRILEANPAAVSILGFTSFEELQRIPADDLFADSEERCTLIRQLEVVGSTRAREVRTRHPAKGEIILSVASARHVDRQGTPSIYSLFSDVTEHKRLEQELLHAQKLEAVGRLTCGVAHDFNNLLSVIIASSNLLLRELGSENPERKCAEEIRAAAARAADLINHLLSFSRKRSLCRRLVVLNEVVAATEKMLGRVLGENVRLETRLDPQVGPVHIDPGQLERALVNLALNARDAMPAGGTLTLETRSMPATREAPECTPSASERVATLAVRDTGIGMDAATREHLFEPFFSTKAEGKGTGLGLSSVYGMVRQNGGSIRVESAPGQGTCFTICLPEASATPDECEQASPAAPDPAKARTAAVLVVEDDPAVRRIVCRELALAGYAVLEAADAHTARALTLGRGGDRLDLLVIDVMMPGRSGAELAGELRRHHPGLRTLYLSGNEQRPDDAPGPLLTKPFAVHQLLAAVRATLDRA